MLGKQPETRLARTWGAMTLSFDPVPSAAVGRLRPGCCCVCKLCTGLIVPRDGERGPPATAAPLGTAAQRTSRASALLPVPRAAGIFSGGEHPATRCLCRCSFCSFGSGRRDQITLLSIQLEFC